MKTRSGKRLRIEEDYNIYDSDDSRCNSDEEEEEIIQERKQSTEEKDNVHTPPSVLQAIVDLIKGEYGENPVIYECCPDPTLYSVNYFKSKGVKVFHDKPFLDGGKDFLKTKSAEIPEEVDVMIASVPFSIKDTFLLHQLLEMVMKPFIYLLPMGFIESERFKINYTNMGVELNITKFDKAISYHIEGKCCNKGSAPQYIQPVLLSRGFKKPLPSLVGLNIKLDEDIGFKHTGYTDSKIIIRTMKKFKIEIPEERTTEKINDSLRSFLEKRKKEKFEKKKIQEFVQCLTKTISNGTEVEVAITMIRDDLFRRISAEDAANIVLDCMDKKYYSLIKFPFIYNDYTDIVSFLTSFECCEEEKDVICCLSENKHWLDQRSVHWDVETKVELLKFVIKYSSLKIVKYIASLPGITKSEHFNMFELARLAIDRGDERILRLIANIGV